MANAPSLIAQQAGRIMSILNALLDHAQTFVVGGAVTDGGTTQASGASAALNFDVDVTQLYDISVNGVAHPGGLAAATDADSDGGSGLDWGATSGVSAVLALVLSTGADNDTPAYETVQGTVAVTGQQVPPTDAEIAASLTHSNFVRVCDVTINRTADTTVTMSFNHDVRNPAADFPQIAEDVGFRS